MLLKSKRQREIDTKLKMAVIEIAELRSEGRYEEADKLETILITWSDDRRRNWLRGYLIGLICASLITNVILMIINWEDPLSFFRINYTSYNEEGDLYQTKGEIYYELSRVYRSSKWKN